MHQQMRRQPEQVAVVAVVAAVPAAMAANAANAALAETVVNSLQTILSEGSKVIPYAAFFM
jgi:predicted lipoprotein with Yx(FWY)xxD motif